MSLKPPKKSDLGKSWMKNRRDKARMIQPEYHLIASEGTETEPQYFGAIQRIINSKYRDRIQLKVEGIGDNTFRITALCLSTSGLSMTQMIFRQKISTW